MTDAAPQHFATQTRFRAWLARNHAAADELWVGFYKKGSGKNGMTYPEAVEEALCWGWIDGIVKRVDEVSYKQRFTPRKPKSHWSNVNVRKAEELIRDGRMAPSGLAAFEARDPERTGKASFEQESHALSPAREKAFRSNRKAWAFFTAQRPSYQRVMKHWVESAKREETRKRRFAALLDSSAKGRAVPRFEDLLGMPKKPKVQWSVECPHR